MYPNILLVGVYTYVQHVLRDRQQPSLPTNYCVAGGNYAALPLWSHDHS